MLSEPNKWNGLEQQNIQNLDILHQTGKVNMWKFIILKFMKHKPMYYIWSESSVLNFHLRHATCYNQLTGQGQILFSLYFMIRKQNQQVDTDSILL